MKTFQFQLPCFVEAHRKIFSKLSWVIVSISRKSHYDVLLSSNKNCVQNTQKSLLYVTLSSLPPYVFKPKTENKNLYNTCLNVTSCIKVKNGKKIRNARLYDRNREKCKSSLQAQKKSTIKIKILYVSFRRNLQCQSVSLFLLPSVCVHP